MKETMSPCDLKTKDKYPSKSTALMQFGIDKVMTDEEAYETGLMDMGYQKSNMLIKRKGQVTLRKPEWVVLR